MRRARRAPGSTTITIQLESVEDREKLKARAKAEGARDLSGWVRRKLGLPKMKDCRGRPKKPRKPRMSQLPLLPNEPPQAADAPPEKKSA